MGGAGLTGLGEGASDAYDLLDRAQEHDHHIAGDAFGDHRHGGAAVCPHDQVGLLMTTHCPAIHPGRALAVFHRSGQLLGADAFGARRGTTTELFALQVCCQPLLNRAFGGDVDAVVNGFVAPASCRILGMTPPRGDVDLLGRNFDSKERQHIVERVMRIGDLVARYSLGATEGALLRVRASAGTAISQLITNAKRPSVAAIRAQFLFLSQSGVNHLSFLDLSIAGHLCPSPPPPPRHHANTSNRQFQYKTHSLHYSALVKREPIPLSLRTKYRTLTWHFSPHLYQYEELEKRGALQSNSHEGYCCYAL